MYDDVVSFLVMVGTLGAAAAIWFAFGQLQLLKQQLSLGAKQLALLEQQVRQIDEQARTSFEDDLTREYRSIISDLPADAFFDDPSEALRPEYTTAFFRYFDLTNQQLFLAADGRISERVHAEWVDGILANMDRPAFCTAWTHCAGRLPDDFFEPLRQLVPPEVVRS